jgi:hypothetical protein
LYSFTPVILKISFSKGPNRVAVIITMLLFILVAKPTGVYLEKAFQGSKTLDKELLWI